MAIKINNTDVITNSPDIVNVRNGNYTGIVTAVRFVGDGSTLTNLSSSGGTFDVGITSTVQVKPLSYDSTLFTFPSTPGLEYVINSINVANVSTQNTEINIIAALNQSGVSTGKQVYLAYNVPIEPGGSVELLKQPHIAGPSDFITMWTTDTTYAGVSNAAEVYINYTSTSNTNYFFVGISSNAVGFGTVLTGIFTSTSNPSVIQSIHLVNRTDDGDYPVSVQVINGASTSYLVKDLVIPRYSTVELCDMPKRIETNGIIRVGFGTTTPTIDVSISGKKIV